jgi:hypothetical protein
MTASFRRLSLLLVILSLILSGALSACSAGSEHAFSMAPIGNMPADVQSASLKVQQAYQFAYANPGVAMHIPCYCGCKALGHESNYFCYVSSVDVDGVITYDAHAIGCSICVDITQDTMRMLQQGKSVPEIKTYIDQTYTKYDPPDLPQTSD